MWKHQPRLLFDTVQLLEIGLLGSTVLVWLKGERMTGAALEEGTEEIVGLLKQPWHILQSPLLTRSQLRDVCTVWSHFGVVCQGSARACVLSLGGCPVAVTVYPPGRGCLHSALLTQSPGCDVYPSTERQVVHAERFTPQNTCILFQRTERKCVSRLSVRREEF